MTNLRFLKLSLFGLFSIFLFVILLIFLGVAAVSSSSGERTFEASLSGNEEVPPVQTKARGKAKFQLTDEGDKLTYTLIISSIKDVIGCYVYKGKKGKNGPPVINLFTEPRKEDVAGTLLAGGKVEPYLLIGPLKGKPVKALIQLMQAGQAYVNIQTKNHPEGEIRGQIR